jgi:transcriptional regulator with XRE-family HTH domain
MNNNDIIKSNTSRLVTYIRKSRNLSSEEFAKELGLTRHSLTRIENMDRSLKLEEYALLCEFADIEFTSVANDSIEIDSVDDNNAFKIPKKWQVDQHSHSGAIDMYSKFFKNEAGEKIYNQFCKEEKIDPIYFYNKNNSINMGFLQNMIKKMISGGYLKGYDNLHKFYKFSADHIVNNVSFNIGITTPYEKLIEMPTFLERYESNHEYRLEKIDAKNKEAHISMRPMDHLDAKIWKDDYLIGGFVENLIKETVAMATGVESYDANFTQRYGQKGSKWTTFKVKLH